MIEAPWIGNPTESKAVAQCDFCGDMIYKDDPETMFLDIDDQVFCDKECLVYKMFDDGILKYYFK